MSPTNRLVTPLDEDTAIFMIDGCDKSLVHSGNRGFDLIPCHVGQQGFIARILLRKPR